MQGPRNSHLRSTRACDRPPPCLTLHTSPSKEKETSQKKVHVKHFSSHKYVYLQRLCIQRWDQTAAREAGSTSNTVTMPNTNPTHWARPHHRWVAGNKNNPWLKALPLLKHLTEHLALFTVCAQLPQPAAHCKSLGPFQLGGDPNCHSPAVPSSPAQQPNSILLLAKPHGMTAVLNLWCLLD